MCEHIGEFKYGDDWYRLHTHNTKLQSFVILNLAISANPPICQFFPLYGVCVCVYACYRERRERGGGKLLNQPRFFLYSDLTPIWSISFSNKTPLFFKRNLMKPSSAPGESPTTAGGVANGASTGAGGGPPNTSISRPWSEGAGPGPGAATSAAAVRGGERGETILHKTEMRMPLQSRHNVWETYQLYNEDSFQQSQ